ncbi:hypothetical protein CDD82_2378 [Ophiocordyceps australis]|uniref:Uncharacterized protein n=1 Tax=Ophiocordyceps australis TaxID=1399860 RepID=A0A2C5XUU7_9HYPO|nr:hypothetical protein CDD82_2378 [Ophiocordyceps australis]
MGALYGLLVSPPQGPFEFQGQPTMAAVNLSRAILDALPPGWVQSFHRYAGWKTEDTLDAISESIRVLTPERLSATVKSFERLSHNEQHLCWMSKPESMPENYLDFFGYLSEVFLNANTLGHLVPRRLWDPILGKAATEIPQLFNPRDYDAPEFVNLLRNSISSYQDSVSSQEATWFSGIKETYDILGGRIGRTIYNTLVQNPPCPNDVCSIGAVRGVPYLPPDALSVLSFYKRRFEDGVPFIVTTTMHNITTDLYWMHLGIDKGAMTPAGEEIVHAWRRRDLGGRKRRGMAEMDERHSGPVCIMEFDGAIMTSTTPIAAAPKSPVLSAPGPKPPVLKAPVPNAPKPSTPMPKAPASKAVPPKHPMPNTHMPKALSLHGPPLRAVPLQSQPTSISIESWGHAVPVNMYRARRPGPLTIRGPAILHWGDQRAEIPDGETLTFVDMKNTARQLVKKVKLVQYSPSFPLSLNSAPIFEKGLPENLIFEGGKWAAQTAAPVVRAFEDGWAKTNWVPVSAPS